MRRSKSLRVWIVGLSSVAALMLMVAGSGTAQAQTWANSNISATPPTILDWLAGGPNTQATWTGGAPTNGSGTTIQFFDGTAAGNAVANTAAASQTAYLNTNVFALGTLTLSGRGSSASTSAHLFESLSGGTLQFPGTTATINLNAVLGSAHLAFQLGNPIQLGTASSASALTITGGGSGAFFIAGNISELQAGGGSLTKSGSSLVTLAGINTYTGPTQITNGTLRLGSPKALPGGIEAAGGMSALTISNAVVELAVDNFLRNLGSGPSQFRITGGTSGFSSRAGARQVIVNNDASQEIQWGSSDFNPTALVLNAVTADGPLTLHNKIDLNTATRTINADGNGDRGPAALSGVIRTSSGTAGLTKGGTGILMLNGTNTFDGVVTISGGTLSINSMPDGGVASPLGQSTAAAANLKLGNATTLRYTGSGASSDHSFTINGTAAAHGATLDASGSGALNLTSTATPAYGTTAQTRTLTLSGSNPGTNTLAALITDNGAGIVSLTKSGNGAWVLSNTNTFTGAVTINGNDRGPGGTLIINSIANGGSPSALGASPSAAANLKLGVNTTLKYIGPLASSDRSFTINCITAGEAALIDASGTGALNLTSTATPAYGTTAQTRTLTLSGSNIDTNSLSALLANNGGAAVTLAKAGQGKWVLNGTSVNTYTGGTTIVTGTLALDFANLGTPTDLVNNGSLLTLGGGTLSLLGHASIASSQTFGNPVFGSQAGSGLSLAGASGMTLTLGNTWTRNAGSTLNVTLGAGGTLASTPTAANTLVVGSGNIAFATVGGADWAKVSAGNVVAFAGGDYDTTFPASGATSTVNYSLTDSGTVTATETANTLKITTSTSGQSLAITAGQTLTLNAGGLLFTGADDYTITGGTLKGSGGTQKELAVHQFSTGNLTVDSVIANNSTATVLTKTGTGTLTLGAANTHSGNTYAGGGGTVVLKNQLALQSSPLFLNNCTLVFDSSVTTNAFTMAGLNAPYAGPGYDIALQNNAGAPIALTVNGGGTYNGNLSGTGSLIKSGSGTLVLTGNNTFTGGITINTGGAITLGARNDWALGGGGTFGNVQVTVNSGGTLNLQAAIINGTLTMNGGLLDSANNFGTQIWSGSIILQSMSTFLSGGNAGSLNILAVISGPGGFAKGTSSEVVLQAANTFTGDTRINGAKLALAHPLALQNSTLDTQNSVVGGSGNGLRIVANTLTLGGLSGNKNLSALFTTAFGGSFYSNMNQPSLSAATPLGGYSGLTELVLNPNVSQTPSYSGGIADGAPGMTLVKTGAGKQTLSGANTYTGATIINAGTLALGANNVLPDVSAVSLGAGTLDMDTFTDTVGTLDVTGAATINLGSGAALVFADSRAVDWTGGTLTVTGTLGATSIRFGTDANGLTAEQLQQIMIGDNHAGISATGYLEIKPFGTVISIR